ncbi:SIMPL domain-containing protein [Haloferax marisrubri]|uniref:SIMPL domain-containing protein n=1 Tax=Haloferax marisrubri TaxID=1544719 RepID=A0A2P4NPN7_9EURY|nr:SIMPL domain-containing protein [Haloferax marisrubri]POG55094.1 SIMPL domain-containing protein [Haloferax marisrubri]
MTDGTITTSATGRVREEPDFAKVSVRIRGEGHTASGSRDAARDRSAAVIDALVTSGIDESSIQQVTVQVKENMDIFDESFDYEYEAAETFVVRCDLEMASDAIVAAIDAGASINYVEYGFPEETRERLKESALENAMEKTRRRAETIADAIGSKLGPVTTVTTEDVEETADGMQDIVDEAMGFDPSIKLNPGHIVVDAQVVVCYRLEQTATDHDN